MVDAARTLFLRNGYAGTTMEEIAALAGIARRTVFNNYTEKDALFIQIVGDVIAYAEIFARALREEFTVAIPPANLRAWLDDLARRLALAIMRGEVIALRRLLIGEARSFPELAAEYFARAPAQVIDTLALGFDQLGQAGLLRVPDARRAAAQFAYLVVGEPLDHAMVVGAVPPKEQVIACAREGVETFLARYGVARGGRRKKE